jgi:hypothetical protein
MQKRSAPALEFSGGFRLGEFQLCRPVGIKGEKCIPPPPATTRLAASAQRSASTTRTIESNAVANTTTDGSVASDERNGPSTGKPVHDDFVLILIIK